MEKIYKVKMKMLDIARLMGITPVENRVVIGEFLTRKGAMIAQVIERVRNPECEISVWCGEKRIA